MVVGRWNRQRVIVDLARHEVTDDEVDSFEDLVRRWRLVQPASYRLEIVD